MFKMINSENFSKRLNQIMEYYKLSASAFAEKIRVQRSSISHILSGRNKPSLEFVMKIVKEFDEVELYWLLNGKGSFPKNITTPTLPDAREENQNTSAEKTTEPKIISSSEYKKKNIERIVIFYTDGTFNEYIR